MGIITNNNNGIYCDILYHDILYIWMLGIWRGCWERNMWTQICGRSGWFDRSIVFFFASVRFFVHSWLATASLGYPIGHISFPAGYGLPPGNQHLWMVFPLKSTFLMGNSQLAMVSSTDKRPSALWLSRCLPLLVLQTCLLVVVQAMLVVLYLDHRQSSSAKSASWACKLSITWTALSVHQLLQD